MSVYPDTLVLKLEEHDKDLMSIDTTMYVLYDYRNETFIVRGKRRGREYKIYSFECETLSSLASFIELTVCNSNVDYGLYNYTNLSEYAENITFDSLDENTVTDLRDREVISYVEMKLNNKNIRQLLDILRNVINPY